MSYITDIDLVRSVVEHIIDDETNYLVASMYMSTKQSNIERFEQKMLDILDDKSRADLLAKVVVVNSGSSEITGLSSKYICSFGFNVRFDFALINKLAVVEKMRDIIENGKGRKFDLIVSSDGDTYVSIPCDGKYAKAFNIFNIANFMSSLDIYTALTTTLGLDTSLLLKDDIIYVYDTVGLSYASFKVGTKSTGAIPVTLVETIGTTFTKRKISLSFESIDGSEDFRRSNGKERTQYFINGQATVCDGNAMLGNDMVKFEISYDNVNFTTLEPMSIPSDVDFNGEEWRTNKDSPRMFVRNFQQANKSEYNFAVDYTTLSQFFYNLAKKGTFSISGLSHNTSWYIKETYNNFGAITTYSMTCKLDKVSTTNTNGDIMLVSTSFKVEA